MDFFQRFKKVCRHAVVASTRKLIYQPKPRSSKFKRLSTWKKSVSSFKSHLSTRHGAPAPGSYQGSSLRTSYARVTTPRSGELAKEPGVQSSGRRQFVVAEPPVLDRKASDVKTKVCVADEEALLQSQRREYLLQQVSARSKPDVQSFLANFEMFTVNSWIQYLDQLQEEDREEFFQTNSKFLFWDESFWQAASFFAELKDSSVSSYAGTVNDVFKAGQDFLPEIFGRWKNALQIFDQKRPAELFARALVAKQTNEFLNKGYVQHAQSAFNFMAGVFHTPELQSSQWKRFARTASQFTGMKKRKTPAVSGEVYLWCNQQLPRFDYLWWCFRTLTLFFFGRAKECYSLRVEDIKFDTTVTGLRQMTIFIDHKEPFRTLGTRREVNVVELPDMPLSPIRLAEILIENSKTGFLCPVPGSTLKEVGRNFYKRYAESLQFLINEAWTKKNWNLNKVPLNYHFNRTAFSAICKKIKGIEDTRVRLQMGHKLTSTCMEDTYLLNAFGHAGFDKTFEKELLPRLQLVDGQWEELTKPAPVPPATKGPPPKFQPRRLRVCPKNYHHKTAGPYQPLARVKLSSTSPQKLLVTRGTKRFRARVELPGVDVDLTVNTSTQQRKRRATDHPVRKRQRQSKEKLDEKIRRYLERSQAKFGTQCRKQEK